MWKLKPLDKRLSRYQMTIRLNKALRRAIKRGAARPTSRSGFYWVLGRKLRVCDTEPFA